MSLCPPLALLTGVAEDFADLADFSEALRVLGRGKAAGMRTHMLVSAGAAMFVLIPITPPRKEPVPMSDHLFLPQHRLFLSATALALASPFYTVKGAFAEELAKTPQPDQGAVLARSERWAGTRRSEDGVAHAPELPSGCRECAA